jgi:hypothetical protein
LGIFSVKEIGDFFRLGKVIGDSFRLEKELGIFSGWRRELEVFSGWGKKLGILFSFQLGNAIGQLSLKERFRVEKINMSKNCL